MPRRARRVYDVNRPGLMHQHGQGGLLPVQHRVQGHARAQLRASGSRRAAGRVWRRGGGLQEGGMALQASSMGVMSCNELGRSPPEHLCCSVPLANRLTRAKLTSG